MMSTFTTKILYRLKYILDAILDTLFPTICLACDRKVEHHEELFCIVCQHQVRMTEYHLYQNNHITNHFPELKHLVTATAMFPFVKAGKVQISLELLKYKNRPDIGLRYGRHYGKILKNAQGYNSIEVIIPVPLHPKRQAQRGYNQSEKFAIGLSESMNIKVFPEALIRKTYTQTQTSMNRIDRQQNMKDIFLCKSEISLDFKNVMLVDDILTTGATLDACAHEIIKKFPNVKLYLVTIAAGY